jgi:hypothetical protein
MTDGKFDLQKLQVASPCYERWDQMKGYEWPVIGVVMEKVYPPPRLTLGAMVRPP